MLLGQQLYETLENGVSRYPRLDGRFPQVSGIRFQFNPYKKSGERINANTVLVNGRPLDHSKVRLYVLLLVCVQCYCWCVYNAIVGVCTAFLC